LARRPRAFFSTCAGGKRHQKRQPLTHQVKRLLNSSEWTRLAGLRLQAPLPRSPLRRARLSPHLRPVCTGDSKRPSLGLTWVVLRSARGRNEPRSCMTSNLSCSSNRPSAWKSSRLKPTPCPAHPAERRLADRVPPAVATHRGRQQVWLGQWVESSVGLAQERGALAPAIRAGRVRAAPERLLTQAARSPSLVSGSWCRPCFRRKE